MTSNYVLLMFQISQVHQIKMNQAQFLKVYNDNIKLLLTLLPLSFWSLIFIDLSCQTQNGLPVYH